LRLAGETALSQWRRGSFVRSARGQQVACDSGAMTVAQARKRTALQSVVRAIVSCAAFALVCVSVSAAPGQGAQRRPWWHWFPSFCAGTPDQQVQSAARVAFAGYGCDPTWGPYAQRLAELDGAAALRELKSHGLRAVVWIEAFGDAMLYAATFEKLPDGSFLHRDDAPGVALTRRSHWCWAVPDIPQGNVFRWVGIHSSVNDEDFATPLFSLAATGVPLPTYPDGRPAVGWLDGRTYPFNAAVYDACGSKDINGEVAASYEPPDGVNEIDPATGERRGPTEGLYPAVLGRDEVPAPQGLKPGDVVYAGVISVHKDLCAPFWRDYVRYSIRRLAAAGVDGVWCDNYSAWDNFGYPPVRKAFGEWSLHRFRRFICTLPSGELARLGIEEPTSFDVRAYLKTKAAQLGAKNPSILDDLAWCDPRWLDDPVWCAYKAFRQLVAHEDLRAYYEAIHEEARRAGRPDFCVQGNDVPLYGLGWVRDDWLDMVNTEVSPGWHMGTGSRGIMLPPLGKMAVVYRVSLEHQKGPFTAAWYYSGDEPTPRKSALGKVLEAEAFANGAFLLCDPSNPSVAGTLDSHRWWNSFVRRHERVFGIRRPWADVGLVFSADNQLFFLAPGGFADMDRQPHVFGHYGWATALIDAHVPYRVLTDWQLDASHLKGLRTLVMPHVECLADEAVRAVEEWVRGGGRLVLTGPWATRHGPERLFRRRGASPLPFTLGPAGRPVVELREGKVGKGMVCWSAGAPGLDYYLRIQDRPALLPQMARLLGPPSLLKSLRLPTTVGIFTWESPDGTALFADLVNYDLPPHAEAVRPAEGLGFSLRLPAGRSLVGATTLTPDATPPASVRVRGGWAEVILPRLVHYASIKLTLSRGTTTLGQ